MSDPVIREARLEDLPEWSRLRTLLWPETKDGHRAEIQAYFSDTTNDIVKTWVIDGDDQGLIGFIELNLRNFVEGSRSPLIPYIEGWYIDTAYQNQGHGRRLIDRAEKWALDNGYTELASDAEIDNEHSIAVHKKLGFKETMRIACFLKKLD